ncbi:MAG: DNA recombination protein RmuC [Streptococcus sp.]|nr:DNA recombination protein RmuC [Streptococcus sp.]
MLFFILLITIINLLFILFFYRQYKEDKKSLVEKLEANTDNLSDQITYLISSFQKEQQLFISQQLNQLQTQIFTQLSDLREVLHQNLSETRDKTDQRLEFISKHLMSSVSEMRESNAKSLEDMRKTVEEKLEATLQNRLQASFETVSLQLENVNKGLGEMKSVAQDVGKLHKVLSNTKTRGILGELQLGQIIEDILTDAQYEREFSTVPHSTNRVEYAIKLPGKDEGDYVYLPIDSKFPLEDYYRLEESYEQGDKEQIITSRKALQLAIKKFAKDINEKYLNPPATTNFGIMFLPTEGLYSEIVRDATFFDTIRKDENIIIAGPSTLSAILNSLSVGFKTLNIQKNANDISKILGNVKLEFEKFSHLLIKAQKQMNTASKSIDLLISTRTNAIIRALNTVESYQDDSTQSFLNLPHLEVEENNEN